jgi:hypothetical protein
MLGCWEQQLGRVFYVNCSVIAPVDMLTVQVALWSHDCLNMQQALEIDMHSECLHCVAERVRSQFLLVLRYPEPDGE